MSGLEKLGGAGVLSFEVVVDGRIIVAQTVLIDPEAQTAAGAAAVSSAAAERLVAGWLPMIASAILQGMARP